MKLIKKIKKKLFPEEEDILFYDLSEVEDKKYRVYKPTSSKETQTIANDIKNKIPIKLDISEMDKKEAFKMINFLAGVLFVYDCKVFRETNNIFIFNINKD